MRWVPSSPFMGILRYREAEKFGKVPQLEVEKIVNVPPLAKLYSPQIHLGFIEVLTTQNVTVWTLGLKEKMSSSGFPRRRGG